MMSARLSLIVLLLLTGCAHLSRPEIKPLTPLDEAVIFCLDLARETEKQVEVGGTIFRNDDGGLKCSTLAIGRRRSVQIPVFITSLAVFHTHLRNSQLSWTDKRGALEGTIPDYMGAPNGRVTVYECTPPGGDHKRKCSSRIIR